MQNVNFNKKRYNDKYIEREWEKVKQQFKNMKNE